MLNQETAKAARTDSGYILRAPRRMRVADAVAQYMRVPMGAGNSVPWDPLVAPYVIEPMNCLASREYDAVIFVGPARTGKTIGLIDGWVIYNVICDPADMLIIQMTEEKAREHSKKRLARTFRVSPEVVSRLSPNKNDNNVYDRTFLAGNYLKIGWPSVNIMSSSDYKCVALTDYDRFPEDIDGEGDAFSLASKRTTTFMSSGMTLVESSPGRDVKDVKWRRTSPHEAPPTTGILSLYNRGDRRRWYWPCPHCGEYFQPCGDVVAGFRDIADPVLASEAAYIQCPSCSGRIMPEHKRELNGRGVWLRDGESINADGSRYGDPRRSRIASFWMEGLSVKSVTTSSPVKSGGGRVEILGSVADFSAMSCYVRGLNSTGSSAAWVLGMHSGESKMVSLKNYHSNAEILLNGSDGAVQLKTGAVNGATAQALTINKNEVNSTVDLTLTKQTGTGNRFVLQNTGNAELPFSVRVWGSSTRQNVFEVGTSAAYLFYAQKTSAGQLFDVNGAINCTTLNQSSDRDLKDDILVISDATKAIRKMNGYTYTLKENGMPYAGVIAQEVMEAIPEAVGSFTHYGEELQGPTVDGNELREETRYLNVDYAAVTGLLVQVARETDDRVTALEEENTTLRQNLATAGTRISTLENQVSELVALVRQLTGSEH